MHLYNKDIFKREKKKKSPRILLSAASPEGK